MGENTIEFGTVDVTMAFINMREVSDCLNDKSMHIMPHDCGMN
jgi:hypothetical protein